MHLTSTSALPFTKTASKKRSSINEKEKYYNKSDIYAGEDDLARLTELETRDKATSRLDHKTSPVLDLKNTLKKKRKKKEEEDNPKKANITV